MQKKNKKFGFTLVELIIVIMIVGISATLVSTSYVVAKRKAELNMSIDRIVSQLKESRSRVKSGYRVLTRELTEGGETLLNYGRPMCYGVAFNKEKGFMSIETEYKDGICQKETINENGLIFSDSIIQIDHIEIGGKMENYDINVLFEPPTGEIILISEGDFYEERNIKIDLFAFNKEDETNHKFIEIDTVSGKMGVAH